MLPELLTPRWRAELAVLALIALISGVAWRLELELRSGWASLEWVRVFHWAVPLGVLAFIAWVVLVSRVRRPSWFSLALGAFACVAYVAVDAALRFLFATGPAAMAQLALSEGELERLWWLRAAGVPLGWALIPLAFCVLCRAFGVRVRLAAALASAVLFTASWPLAIAVRTVFEHRGSPDLIHALKSGFVIPFLMLSLGLPLLARRNTDR